MNSAYASDGTEEEETEGEPNSAVTSEVDDYPDEEEPVEPDYVEPLSTQPDTVEPDYVEPPSVEPDYVEPPQTGTPVEPGYVESVDPPSSEGLSADGRVEPRGAEAEELSGPVYSYLDGGIDVLNQGTGALLSNYEVIETVPDKFAEQVHGISGQFVTTLAFQDRYGREDSNDNLNVFLQVTHTTDKVVSLRGVQLGGDEIQVFVNGADQGTMVKTVELSTN